MNDDDLIAWLRDLAAVLGKEALTCAADRIEALVKERDQWIEHTKNAVWSDSEELKLANARIEALGNEAVLSKAAYEGVSSLLLSVQQDCIKERQRAERLEAALRFYARRGVVSPWVDDEINEDGGVVARTALKGDKP